MDPTVPLFIPAVVFVVVEVDLGNSIKVLNRIGGNVRISLRSFIVVIVRGSVFVATAPTASKAAAGAVLLVKDVEDDDSEDTERVRRFPGLVMRIN